MFALRVMEKHDVVKHIAAATSRVFDFLHQGRSRWSRLKDLSTTARCFCITLSVENSHRESVRLGDAHEQTILCPVPYDEVVQLH